MQTVQRKQYNLAGDGYPPLWDLRPTGRVCIYALSDPRLGRTHENVRYVGKTHQTLYKRKALHCVRKETSHKHSWILSLKKDGLTPDIWPLAFCGQGNWEEAERFWIAKLKSIGNNLTNATNGGGRGGELSVEARAKISAKAKLWKRKPFSQEHREKIRAKALGRKHTPEQIQKLITSLTGKKRSEEIRQKFREAQRKRRESTTYKPMSEEQKAKISASHIGIRVPDYARAKISKANSKPIFCVETGVRYDSAKKAALGIGVKPASISRAALNGITCKGMHWKYESDIS